MVSSRTSNSTNAAAAADPGGKGRGRGEKETSAARRAGWPARGAEVDVMGVDGASEENHETEYEVAAPVRPARTESGRTVE